MKTLTLISAGLGRHRIEEVRAMERSDQCPRVTLYEEVLNSDMLDEQFALDDHTARRLFYTALSRTAGPAAAQVLEAYHLRKRYDAVVSWSEKLGLMFASLKRFTGASIPHVVLASWISKRKKAMMLKQVHPWIDTLILWSSKQREFAIEQLDIPPSKIAFIKWFVDQKFFRPMPTPQEENLICTAGYEMRDYPTLIEALRGTGIRCHIAAGTIRDVGSEEIQQLIPNTTLPSGITVGRRTPAELRDLYARSQFVVMPIKPTDTDNGLTCILESMAMGRAVICSAVEGQVDIIRHGVNGLYVPPKDPVALREAIRHLLNHPEEAERLGKAGREQIEREHTLEGFVSTMHGIVQQAVVMRPHSTRSGRARTAYAQQA